MTKTKIVKQASKKASRPSPAVLLRRARQALDHAYAPYSGFFVGAAVLNKKGKIYPGSNIENASYPLCLCAERVALAHAYMSDPRSPILAIAVLCRNPKIMLTEPGFPCGACRQVISEFEDKQKAPIRIIVGTEQGKILVFESIKELLPYSFNSEFLR